MPEMQHTRRPRGPMGRGPMGGGGGEKANDTWGALRKLIAYCANHGGIILLALALAALGAVFTIIGPNQISRLTDYIYDGLSSQIDMEGILGAATLLLGIYLASALCSFTQH